MRTNDPTTRTVSAVRVVGILLAGTLTAFGQQQVNLTAGPTSITLPDGSAAPMWGYTCGAVVTGSGATCAPLNPAATGWSPVVITVPVGASGGLAINLTNSLTFTAGTGTNSVPTSLTIIGQLGGGLGSTRTTTPSPAHGESQVTWSTVTTPGAVTFTPPPQGPRVQSFSTEVAAGQTAQLTWPTLRPGTYLIESGTHPSIQGPMGLYGILVVTTPPSGTTAGAAYPGVAYNAEIPMIFSEIDPVQNASVQAAVATAGFSATMVWSGQPGGCGNAGSPTYHQCYPPAVNYTPLYYMINGVAFDKTHASASLFSTLPAGTTAAPVTGSVLVRLVNAGLRMHVPSIVGALTGTTPVAGFSLIAEDGNPLPGIPRVQSEIFMAAGKTDDVLINAGAAGAPALPVFDRELSLSGNATARDAGMLAYIGVNGAALPSAPALSGALARADAYSSLIAGKTLTVSDPSKGLIANDTNVTGVQLLVPPKNGTLTLAANGTFTYVAGTVASDTFTYCANGAVTAGVCSSGITATVTLGAATTGSAPSAGNLTYTANTATYLAIKTPGVLSAASDPNSYPLTLVTSSVKPSGGLTVVADQNGGFTATAPAAGAYQFSYQVQNSQGTPSNLATVTLNFPAGSGLQVKVLDGKTLTAITDYRWIIEEDRTFYIDPTKTTKTSTDIVPTLGVNFHSSYMPYVAQGCTGPKSCESGQTVYDNNPASPTFAQHINAVCDVGNGVCRPDTTGSGLTPVLPGSVALDPTKRYYISILPGDAADPFYGAASVGHGMGGAPIGIDPNTGLQQSAVTVLTESSPYPPAKLSVFVFQDDFPLNGEQDGGGGIDVLSPNEPGLGGFQIHLWDAMGGNGDFTGQMTYDMFNQPLSNSLDGTMDPNTGLNSCPITQQGAANTQQVQQGVGITGMIVTCPKYESDGKTLSPLAGQAVIANLMPGRFGVVATPGADRISRGEEWLQTNTLDGQKAHDSFIRIAEPSYFQEFGPAGYHVSIGFANPAIINARKKGVCSGLDPNLLGTGACGSTITGKVTGQRLSRTPDERLYSSGSYDAYAWTQCYVSFGDPDGEDFAFTKCAADGTFTLSGLPVGDWRITVFDQWNDMLVDGLSTPIRLNGTNTVNIEIPTTQWQTNLYTRTFVDDNKDGLPQNTENGIPFANVAVRLRDGSLENLLVTDFSGVANFNETFPLFSWYTVETDVTRYKNTGAHVVYDAGGPADGSSACGTTGYPPCGTSTIGKYLANTAEQISVPTNLRVPGAVYCAGADCSGKSIQSGPGASDSPSACTTSATGATTCSTVLSTGRIDPPWVGVEGWQGFPGQSNFIEFGKAPYYPGENGGIKGHVVYASTRPFDDPQLLVQTQWEPLVPHVTINLYKEGFAPDGVTPTLTMVDTTQTSSFDDYAQGFHTDATGAVVPNMSCPGQGAATGANPDLFFFSLYNQPDYLDAYNNQHSGTPLHTLPYNSQFKCYDGMHNWNQIQPAPYDGMYQFPSVTASDPATGRPTGTNCTICAASPDPVPAAGPDADPLRSGLPMLPPGKYVVEVVLPPGYELVKEEDKNILIGDNFIAPVTQQFGGMGNIFILPDQASVVSAYNANNAQNPTQSLGAQPENGIVPGFVPEPVWPCVGEPRVVPDFISLFPQSKQVAPFAGATRNLCDRKEVTLADQAGATAKFYVFTSTHIASKYTGGITDDYTSEFDPFSPQFGEKFSPPDLPISFKDWTGNEISRTYADHWGAYNGMTYSTWEVNPPNPTGYSPTMMVVCMNDPGPILDTKVGSPTNGQMITDPLFTQGYSQFCYELPFMPGTTQYLDTPVVPTAAFAGAGYNNVDCAYPDTTPAISSVTGDVAGPWVSAAGTGHTLTINALGPQTVPNYAYSGPSAVTSPFNAKTITRTYGFGAIKGSVTIGGEDAPILGWTDTQITVTVPNEVPDCALQQQAMYGGVPAQCGQLVVTRGDNLKESIDAITVTIGGKPPTVMAAGQTIQSAIDAASPGDLIIVPPGTYNELVLMWKPVRLQGVGAASTIVNANTQPAGKLDPWRRQVDCLFGLAMNGTPITSTNPFDPPSDTANNGGPFACPANMQFQVDRLPLEATVGWDANLNGNMAELLQEPALMGALEGAAITVLSKGVDFHGANPFAASLFAGFPTGTTLLTQKDCGPAAGPNPFPSNFQCNPSRIDGLGITDSSQGGGGIFVHAWGHNIEISNNRIYNNSGTLSGGINVGQGEFPGAYIQGSATNAAPGSCETSRVANTQLPYCHNMNVRVHNNSVTLNSSTGDELFSATPAGAGGVSFCTGSDYYKFNYNWVCGNLSSGDGGGVGHLGFSKNGLIQHNSILFNQSTNPTITANGGGIVIMGTPDADPPCGTTTDADCLAPPNSISPSDGAGPGLVIDANLIMGNGAESGSGGGLRLQSINGSDVLSFPTDPSKWYSVNVTNNIIANNIAGWDGGGISLLDALNVNIINNTIVSNNTTATAGPLFNTLGAPLASSQGPCNGNLNPSGANPCITTSTPQPAGLVSIQNSAVLSANLPAKITCPPNHYSGATATNGNCRSYSYPLLADDVIWNNSVYYIGVGALSPQFQQNIVTLYNGFTTTPAPTQPSAAATTPDGSGVVITGGTGACVASNFWDIGVRGDTAPSNHTGGMLGPTYSVLTDAVDYAAALNNTSSDPTVVSRYCNGSRVPPEASMAGGTGWSVPPGISDATVPNPIFNLTPVATVDEGNNWVNLRWGPLSLVNPVTGYPLGDYSLAAGSPAIDYTPTTVNRPWLSLAPTLASDFFGNPRSGTWDIGAVQTSVLRPVLTSIAPSVLARGGTNVLVTLTGSNLTTITSVTVVDSTGVTVTGFKFVNDTTVTATLTVAANAELGNGSIRVTTLHGTSNSLRFTVVSATAPVLTGITPDTGAQGVAVPVVIAGANLAGATAVAVSGTGVTASAPTVNAAGTSVAATFTIAATAARTARTVTVTSPGGASNTLTFTVTAPAGPVLTGIAPSAGLRGTSVLVTLTGTNLTGATAVTVSGSGVTASAPTVAAGGASLTSTFTIAAAAAATARTVSVTTPTGTTGNVSFTVQGPALASIAPAQGLRGSTVPVTLTGTNLTGATAVNVTGGGITVGPVTVASATSITTTFTIAATASASARTVNVTTPIGVTGNVTFTVTGPTLTGIAPASGIRGGSVAVTLTGTNLTGGRVNTPANVTASGVAVSPDGTTLTATLAVGNAATLGAKNISVATPLGTTANVTFTVLGATATISAPTPALTTAPANTTTKTGTITVTNSVTGANGAPLTMTAAPAITRTGGTGTFSITGGTCTSTTVLNPGTNCTITVQYAPGTSTATATAHITITAADLATATQNGASFNAN